MVRRSCRGGKLRTPSVWDLHLHHVVWFLPDGNRMASGEEKTDREAAAGLRGEDPGRPGLVLNYMIHSLKATSGRSVYLTWEIDWVPETTPAQHGYQAHRHGLARRRRRPAGLSGVRRRARVRHRRRRRVRLPGRGDEPERPRLRGGEPEDQPRTRIGSCPPAASPSSSAPATSTREGSTWTSRSRGTATTPAPSTATTQTR